MLLDWGHLPFRNAPKIRSGVWPRAWVRGVSWGVMWVGLAMAALPTAGLTVSSPPTFQVASNAPLAGTLRLTTDTPSRVSVSVNDGPEPWTRDFFDYGTVHAVPLYGFKPGRTNDITVTVRDRLRHAVTITPPVRFVTGPLPTNFPVLKALVSQPAKMEPGYTLFRGQNNNTTVGYVTLVDARGQVVWYSGTVSSLEEVRQLTNGNLFIHLATNFIEVNLLGETVRSWNSPQGLKVDLHEGLPTPHGTILYLNDDTRVVANFPTSSSNPSAPKQTTSVQFNRVIEMSATTGALLNNWALLDMLDPVRISYLTFTSRTALGWDCEHANAIIEDPRDNSLIVSVRHQNAVIKFSRATGRLKWILGPRENWAAAYQPYLFTSVGTPFVWSYAQHAPVLTPQGTLLVYDNGNFRASPFAASVGDATNYSRAVEYSLNEQTLRVSQVWEYGRTNAERLFTPSVGNVEWLPQRTNVLITFGNTTYVNGVHPSPYSASAAQARIKEVTHTQNPEVVFDLALFDSTNTSSSYLGCYVYRSHRVADLYAHPANPVTDLTATRQGGLIRLAFSADPVRTYVIQTSTNLITWTNLATGQPGAAGQYDFTDGTSPGLARRYYRVLTQ